MQMMPEDLIGVLRLVAKGSDEEFNAALAKFQLKVETINLFREKYGLTKESLN